MSKVRSKATFYRLWRQGQLGNRPRTWDSITELATSGWTGRVGIRSRVPGGPCQYHLAVAEAIELAQTWPCGFVFSEALPDDRLLLQGEVSRLETGVHLTYSTAIGLTMRDAMHAPERATGIAAVAILRAKLWPSSFDDVGDLLDRFPDAVIEFGAHDCAVGILPHRNTIIWEVRDY